MLRLLNLVLACLRNPPTPKDTEDVKRVRKITTTMLERFIGSFPKVAHASSFGQGDVVIHVASEGVYRILLDPRCGLTIESVNSMVMTAAGPALSESPAPAYAYVSVSEDPDVPKAVWVRPAEEFDDGRFKLLKASSGRDRWPAWTPGTEDTIAWRS